MVEKAKRELVQALALLPVLIAMSNPPDLTPLIFSIYVAQPGNIAHHKRLLLINLLFAWLITACLAQINACLESPNYFFAVLGQKSFLPAMLASAICALGMAATLISFRPAHLSSLGVFFSRWCQRCHSFLRKQTRSYCASRFDRKDLFNLRRDQRTGFSHGIWWLSRDKPKANEIHNTIYFYLCGSSSLSDNSTVRPHLNMQDIRA